MSDNEDLQCYQSSLIQQKNDAQFDMKVQDYKIDKTQSANTSFSSGEDYQNPGQFRRIKSDNYYQNDSQYQLNKKKNQNNNSRFQQDSRQSNHQYPNEQQRRKNWKNYRNTNYPNSNNEPGPNKFSGFPMNSNIQQYPNIQTFPNDQTTNQLNLFNAQNNCIPQLNLLNPNFSSMQNHLPKIPYPPQPPKINSYQQINQNQFESSSSNPISSLNILQRISQAQGLLSTNQLYQSLKQNTGGISVLVNSSSQSSSKELDMKIQQQLDEYNEEQINLNYSSWASILNQNKTQSQENKQQGSCLKNNIIQTDFYNESLQMQLEDSVEKLDKGNLVHYQVDISEQDNCSPFEYLKQFKLDSNGNKSLREDYLDLMANLDLYTEKLYYAIQDKAADHLKKNNFNPSTLLQNSNSNNYHHNQSYQQQQQSMQYQRNNAKEIIKGAVQSVLEYSEKRTVVPRYAREGDWLCQCGNLNFQYRNTCNKCLVMKPQYQYKQNTELFVKLDYIEKQLMNIDSQIAPPPQQDQIITQQRQIILSDFIWVCKCCRSINYSKSPMCVSCKMYKFIDRSKLLDITKTSQSKLCKYAFKMQERHKKNLESLKAANSQAEDEEAAQEVSSQQEQVSSQETIQQSIEQLNDKMNFGSALNSQITSSSSSSDEGFSINNYLQNSSLEELNTTNQQISLNSSQDKIALNLSTDSDTKQNQSQTIERKDKNCIYILDQLDKSCDADNSSTDSLEYESEECYRDKLNQSLKKESIIKSIISKKQTPKSNKKSALQSAKSKIKSSKMKEFSILEELKEDPVKKLKITEDYIQNSDNEKTILDVTIQEINEQAEEQAIEKADNFSLKELNRIPEEIQAQQNEIEEQQFSQQQEQIFHQLKNQTENQDFNIEASIETDEYNLSQNESLNHLTLKVQQKEAILQEINEQNDSYQQQSQIAEEESLLLGIDDKDFMDGYFY